MDSSDSDSITSEDFDEQLKDQKLKWSDLEIGKIYKIIEAEVIGADIVYLTLKDGPEILVPFEIYTKLAGKTLPVYIRPLGLKTEKYEACDVLFKRKKIKKDISMFYT